MNLQLFLEHIASTIGRTVEEVRDAVTPEYWKDMCEFGTVRGVPIFLAYVTARNVTSFERFGDGFCTRISERDLNPPATAPQEITLCLSGSYAKRFKREHPEFEYSAR
jgi:hypothetical protein